jgi:hypothetical protein
MNFQLQAMNCLVLYSILRGYNDAGIEKETTLSHT